MFDQLTQLVQQFGNEAVVNNTAVPNEHNQAVLEETSTSIFSSLQKLAADGGVEQLAGLLQGGNSATEPNGALQQITQQLSGSLGSKFGISPETAGGIATSMLPKILNGLSQKANDPQDSFQMSDLIGALAGNGSQASGIMDAISKYGTQFGLDQNADGKVDMTDAMNLTKGTGGIAGILGKLFGK